MYHAPNYGIHRTALPPPPLNWKELIKHPKAEEFKLAAAKEMQDIEKRNTWRVINSTDIDYSIKLLLLKWVFTYKFNTDGYLD